MSGAMIGKGDFRHFMVKEIYEQPSVIGETLNTMLNPATRTITLPPLPFEFVSKMRKTFVLFFLVQPWSLVEHARLLTPLMVFAFAAVLYGLDGVAWRLENPLGFDDEDLPLGSDIVTVIMEALEMHGRLGGELDAAALDSLHQGTAERLRECMRRHHEGVSMTDLRHLHWGKGGQAAMVRATKIGTQLRLVAKVGTSGGQPTSAGEARVSVSGSVRSDAAGATRVQRGGCPGDSSATQDSDEVVTAVKTTRRSKTRRLVPDPSLK